MKGDVRAVSHALTGENAFSARVEPHGETVIVEASGDLDLSVAKTFEDELRRALSNGTAEVVLDLAEVTFIDSTGLRALFRVAEEGRRNGDRLSIRRDLSPPVKRLLDLTACGDQLPFAD
jgi:anti-anti-sigma factor